MTTPESPRSRPEDYTIVTAGMIRSGSTWLFNAVRLLAPDDFDASGWHADLPEGGGRRLVKLHDPMESWASRANLVLTTRRDLRDIAASLISMGWDQDIPKAIDEAVTAHDWWMTRSALEIPYENIVRSPAKALEALADVLNVLASDQRRDEIVAQLAAIAAPSDGGYDKTTLLHPGHRQSGQIGRWRSDLNAELLDHISHAHGGWLRRYNYV